MQLTLKRSLKITAALIWYIGGAILLRKGLSLVSEAKELEPILNWHWLGYGFGITWGLIKAIFIFKKSVNKNMDRIEAMEKPRFWQFFSGKFFFFLTLMITTGVLLSRASHGNYPMLIAVGGLDLSISIALLGSSLIYWKRWK